MTAYKFVLEDVKKWVRSIGEFQTANFGRKDLGVQTKSSRIDLVTEVDKHSEEYLLGQIKAKYPGHAVLAEESGQDGPSGSEYRWIIDPLDGTTNYAQGLPMFAVSVALEYRKETVLGVVYLPKLGLLFEAVRGEGAFLNGQRLAVGRKDNLRDSLLATGFPYDIAEHKDNNLEYFGRLVPKARGIRRIGSAAYDLANVAAGIIDGYWELNLQPWDVAAGMLLVEEAGGKIIRLKDKRGVSLIAGNEIIADLIRQEIES